MYGDRAQQIMCKKMNLAVGHPSYLGFLFLSYILLHATLAVARGSRGPWPGRWHRQCTPTVVLLPLVWILPRLTASSASTLHARSVAHLSFRLGVPPAVFRSCSHPHSFHPRRSLSLLAHLVAKMGLPHISTITTLLAFGVPAFFVVKAVARAWIMKNFTCVPDIDVLTKPRDIPKVQGTAVICGGRCARSVLCIIRMLG